MDSGDTLKYIKKRDEKLQILKECQKQKCVNSCLKCKEALGCKIREEYVRAVYESMSKGEGGGFDFQ